MHGADPSENTYRSLVDWASKIENRLKQTKACSVSITQWLAEGKSAKKSEPRPKSQPYCYFCRKNNHITQDCFRLRRAQNSQKIHSKADGEILNQLENLIIKSNTPENSTKQTVEKSKNLNNPYRSLQTDLANLLAKYNNPQ